jgi:hypothetical protein
MVRIVEQIWPDDRCHLPAERLPTMLSVPLFLILSCPDKAKGEGEKNKNKKFQTPYIFVCMHNRYFQTQIRETPYIRSISLGQLLTPHCHARVRTM